VNMAVVDEDVEPDRKMCKEFAGYHIENT
jgi:hypothetical protein